MVKKFEIYKKDKWNMLHIEVQGKQIIVREISDQWGEDTHNFLSRPSLMDWATHRFTPERFDGTEEERLEILEKIREV